MKYGTRLNPNSGADMAKLIHDRDALAPVTNGTAGIYYIENAPNDFSVKVVSGDETKNVTFVRFAGPTAEQDAANVTQMLMGLAQLVGAPLK